KLMLLCWFSFFPVNRTFSALITTTKSPVSTCGVKIVFSLPRSKLAALTATWPSTWSLASITHHLRGTWLAFAEKVFIGAEKARKLRAAPGSVKFSAVDNSLSPREIFSYFLSLGKWRLAILQWRRHKIPVGG